MLVSSGLADMAGLDVPGDVEGMVGPPEPLVDQGSGREHAPVADSVVAFPKYAHPIFGWYDELRNPGLLSSPEPSVLKDKALREIAHRHTRAR